MKKRAWKSTFSGLIPKMKPGCARFGPLDPDMMPIALFRLLSGDPAPSGRKKASVPAAKAKRRTEMSAVATEAPSAETPGTETGNGKHPVFYVTASQSRAEQCRDDLTAWAEVAGRRLAMHILPDGSTRRQSLLQSDSPRAEALHRLLLEPPDVFFGSVTSLTSPAPVPRLMRESELELKVGAEMDLKALAERLV